MRQTFSRWRRLIPALLLLPFLAAPVAAQAQGTLFSPAQRAEIVEILREALRQDPSILRDALMGLEEAEQQQRTEARRAAITQQAEALFRDAADPVRGNPRGDVTIVEFFDARCGYCKQLHPALEALLRRDPNVRIVMKDLPILGPNSVLAARALLAAQRQGRYPALQDALLSLRTEPTEAVLRQQAERVGLDWSRLRREMDDPAIARRIEANVRLAQTLGIQGTPALVVASSADARGAGATLVPGAVDLAALERMVAEARAAR
ncbi:disulfide bond formation protein DsbA [Falsiroseomonas bella]|uniref:Disulfide bond formation protein DsbA n=1 Tax=Falsiroseomonas bella TaxID=2184016 RepID=A0A317FIX5_9PROT|nr:DsbA family protein [Falsiroseomonas bella]PWS37909.1 disulfide bond formation protein DsbA [Falsiroseomonas bella]